VRVQWLSIAKSAPVYALIVAHFTCGVGNYIVLERLRLYFRYVLHLDIKAVSLTTHVLAYRLLIDRYEVL